MWCSGGWRSPYCRFSNMSCSSRLAWWMLIASSSQMPRGHRQAQRQPDERHAAPGSGRAVLAARVGLAARGELAARAEQLGLARARGGAATRRCHGERLGFRKPRGF